MSITRYESARKDGGFTPVYFVDYGKLKSRVGGQSEIDLADYVAIAKEIGKDDDVQVHYIHTNGQIIRIFIKGGEWKAKSAIPIGTVHPERFSQVIPNKAGLTESQVNRAVRRTLKELL
ncbi:hypothetical protein HYX06_00955 [Candidatus Woesearchaeota archaeon]|nr:hypothetical protein [Candidatus Woesearchaeota archaeon]